MKAADDSVGIDLADRLPQPTRTPPARDSIYDPVMSARGVSVRYGDKQAIRNVSLDIGRNQVLALIGPSGCGKSTFLRCLNRMNDTIASAKVEGTNTSACTRSIDVGRRLSEQPT